MATTTSSRIERLERELEFRAWVRNQRFLEALSDDELLAWASAGKYPERPEPPRGMSRIDKMEREELRKLWKQDEQRYAGRTGEELAFFALHGHWPERACDSECVNAREHEGEIRGDIGGENVR